MQKILPEIVFASSDPSVSRRIGQLVEAGKLRTLLPRVYTSDLSSTDADIVLRNLWVLLGKLFPGSLLSHRTAIEYSVSPENNIYLTSTYSRVVRWPGVNVRFAKGHRPQEDDLPIYDGLFSSSLERATLENLASSRRIEGEKRTLEREKIEERLIQLLEIRGERGLNTFRDRAREIAEKFAWNKSFKTLDNIISALLATNPGKHLVSDFAISRALGEPYDAHRLKLFQNLVAALKNWEPPVRPEKTVTHASFRLFAFFESFFSNYIEGTTFPVDQAKEIIDSNQPSEQRPRDSHDILGTYQLCADPLEMGRVSDDENDFLDLLRRRHSVILRGRPEKGPGEFKVLANRAGNSVFVAPDQVNGTLKKGYQLSRALTHPLHRALYVMFLVSEVHPFADGNGRVARLMMNAELTAGGQTKLIIPTVYRDDYLLNLRRLTRHHDTAAYLRMMDRAHAFSHWLDPTNYAEMKAQLYRANAFEEEGDRVLQF